jgi:hypothetical protein
LNKKSQQKYYQLVADILNILPPIKRSGDSEQLTKAIMALIELAESAPRMFKGLFNSLVTFSITVIQDKELTDVARQNALELMATFADHAPAMCKKDPSYTSEMVTQCLSLMTDVGADDDDAQEWSLSEDVRAPILDMKLTKAAGHRRKRCQPRCRRAMHGPSGQQAWGRDSAASNIRLAAAHDAVVGLAR